MAAHACTRVSLPGQHHPFDKRGKESSLVAYSDNVDACNAKVKAD